MFKAVWSLISLGALTLCLVAAGCGGSDEEALTKSEFVKQGNSICKEAEAERFKILSKEGENYDPNGDVQAQQAALIEATIPTYEQAAQRLAELEPPEEMADTVDALVAAMEEAGEQAKANPQTAIVSNVQFKEANQKAEDLELEACIS